MFIHRPLKTALSLALIILLIQTIFAQDWPQWRGANRDGVITGFTAPKTWPGQLKQIWKAPVGVGHSSPLVIGSRVYLHSRQAENEVAAAYDLDTGKTIWIVTSATDRGAKVIKKYRVAEKPTWAHPAIVGKSILIKDETTLAMWRLE